MKDDPASADSWFLTLKDGQQAFVQRGHGSQGASQTRRLDQALVSYLLLCSVPHLNDNR